MTYSKKNPSLVGQQFPSSLEQASCAEHLGSTLPDDEVGSPVWDVFVVLVVVAVEDEDDDESAKDDFPWLPPWPGYNWAKSLVKNRNAAPTMITAHNKGTPIRSILLIFSSLVKGLPLPKYCI